MKLKQFLNEYGSYIQNHKEYDNGVIMLQFANPGKVMWLKGIVAEKMNMSVKASSVTTQTYWFE
jgi:hypothetical protein